MKDENQTDICEMVGREKSHASAQGRLGTLEERLV